jgi:hypothetical protein
MMMITMMMMVIIIIVAIVSERTILFLPSNSSVVLTRLSEPRSRATASQTGIEPGPLEL